MNLAQKLVGFLPCFILLGAFSQVLSQSKTLSFYVIDQEDNSAVSYATILYPEQQYGFSANGNGFFQISYQPVENTKQVSITSLGYESFNTTIGEMSQFSSDTIFLIPRITLLEEVLVKAETLSPTEMVKKAAQRLKTIMGSSPYYLYSYYEEQIKKNNKYVGLTQAYGIMHVSGYNNQNRKDDGLLAHDLAQWKQLRRSNYLVHSPCNPDVNRRLEADQLIQAKTQILYQGPLSKNIKNFDYTMDSLTHYNSKDVFIIGFRHLENTDYFGKLYVDVNDYSLVAIEAHLISQALPFLNSCIDKATARFYLSFTAIEQQYFVNVVRLQLDYNHQGATFQEKAVLRSEAFNYNKTVSLNLDQRNILYQEMINPSVAYDSDFWNSNYHVIEDEITNDLAQGQSLEKQFFNNSGRRPIPLPEQMDSYEELYRNRDLFRLYVNGEF